MLGRSANGIFWMFRYLERAENTARLLDAGFRMALTRGSALASDEWRSVLVTIGQHGAFAARGLDYTGHNVTNFILRDRDNPGSVLHMIENARTNARSVRTAITREVWEATNESWMVMREKLARPVKASQLGDVLAAVRSQTMLVRGAMEGTMLRNEVYWFTRLGTFIERADNTARILDVKYHLLLPRDEGVGGAQDYYQWTSILRAVSAVRAYQWVYRTEVKPWNIAELLILRPEMPRSLRACFDEIDGALNQIAASHTGRRGECHRLAGEIASQLRYGRVEDIFRIGLHEYLTEMIERTAKVGDEVRGFYMR